MGRVQNLTKMLALQTDNSMFKQGDPGSFLNVLCTAVLGVDSARVTAATENAQNILMQWIIEELRFPV